MRALTAALLVGLAAGTPASGDVTASSDLGFVTERSVEVSADPAATWRELVRPAGWWQNAHTWSGNAANMTLDPRAGGCFCETLPQAKDMTAPGLAEHMRVIHVAPGRMLRLSGGLGPLQGEAAHGTLTIALAPTAGGTSIKFTYVVGGYMRMKPAQLAPAVDSVLGAQLAGLAARLGGARAIQAKP